VSADPAAPAPTGRRSGIARSIGAVVALTLAVLCLILLWLDAPSLATVLVLAVICVVLLLLIEALRATVQRRVDATDPAGPAGPTDTVDVAGG
jgi:threonine/homoserine/homoserine lactone efflux protein